MIKASVIIPTCHRPKQLRQCLQALSPRVQTCKAGDYEIIVTDDSTNAETRELVAAEFPWVRYTKGPSRGAGSNRNHGATLALAPYLLFVDDDCIPCPEWVEAYIEAAAEGSHVLAGPTVSDYPLELPFYEAPVSRGGDMFSCNLGVSSEFFSALNGFDEDYASWCEDTDFAWRVGATGEVPKLVPDAQVLHPRRRRPFGAEFAKRWEMRVVLWYKQGHKRLALGWIPLHLLKLRLVEFRKMKTPRAYLVAATSLVIEMLVVAGLLPVWEWRYRRFRTSSTTRQGECASL